MLVFETEYLYLFIIIMLSNEIISVVNEKLEIQKSLNYDLIYQLNEIMNEMMINIEDLFSIVDIINRNNNKINNKVHLELENHKIIINDLSLKLDKFKISINSIILISLLDKIEKIGNNGNNYYYFIVNFCIAGIVIYINFLYIYILNK